MYMTAQRKRLFQFFNDHPDASFSARDIQALLNRSEASAISLSAVYRNLASLAEAGLILKSAASDGQETLYRFVGADACRDELHMTCLSCGQTTHVDHVTARAFAQALAGNDEFQMNLGQTTHLRLMQKMPGKIICFLHKEGDVKKWIPISSHPLFTLLSFGSGFKVQGSGFRWRLRRLF